jgi:hypothetical protein
VELKDENYYISNKKVYLVFLEDLIEKLFFFDKKF